MTQIITTFEHRVFDNKEISEVVVFSTQKDKVKDKGKQLPSEPSAHRFIYVFNLCLS